MTSGDSSVASGEAQGGGDSAPAPITSSAGVDIPKDAGGALGVAEQQGPAAAVGGDHDQVRDEDRKGEQPHAGGHEDRPGELRRLEQPHARRAQ